MKDLASGKTAKEIEDFQKKAEAAQKLTYTAKYDSVSPGNKTSRNAFRAFLDNHWLGFAVFAGIALDFGVRLHRWPNAW